ncbi:MAG: metallophosphoesterase [Verrucomicrobiota bacterium]
MSNYPMNRRHFLQLGPATLAALSAPFSVGRLFAQTPGEPPEVGRSSRHAKKAKPAILELGNRQSLRLLQFTDNHFFCGVKEGLTITDDDRKTERDWQKFVRIFSPDLIVFTGDAVHDNPGGRGMDSLLHVFHRVEALGVPWAFCWGNHDILDDYQAGHDALESARHSLYRGGASHGDYRIEVHTHSTKDICWRRTCGFSIPTAKDSPPGSWTGFAPLALLSPKPVLPWCQSLGFYHIPLLEQKTLYAAGRTPGVCQEGVCHEKESGAAAPALAADTRLLACFCGHDHTNDYAVRSRTLDLVYGRATGYAGYGGEKLRKGAKLIELDLRAGQYEQVTVFADGSRWQPA